MSENLNLNAAATMPDGMAAKRKAELALGDSDVTVGPAASPKNRREAGGNGGPAAAAVSEAAAAGEDQPAGPPATGAAAAAAGKAEEEFRNYDDSDRQSVVENHYRLMRANQTLDFVRRMQKKYCSFDHAQMEIREAFEALGDYVDSSDPDSEHPNIEHEFQTAEAIRAAGHPEWFQLVGLIHDIGKLQFLWGTRDDGQEGTADGHQWALGGDTWVVGCAIPDTCVLPEYNKLNPDMNDPRLNTVHGIYSPGCGMNNLNFAWGHDEYAYQVIKNHTDKLRAAGHTDLIPDEGLAMVRFHSCYPWHNKGEYTWAMAPGDERLLQAVLTFNRFDLYTKADTRPDVGALWPYYQALIDKFLPGKIAW